IRRLTADASQVGENLSSVLVGGKDGIKHLPDSAGPDYERESFDAGLGEERVGRLNSERRETKLFRKLQFGVAQELVLNLVAMRDLHQIHGTLCADTENLKPQRPKSCGGVSEGADLGGCIHGLPGSRSNRPARERPVFLLRGRRRTQPSASRLTPHRRFSRTWSEASRMASASREGARTLHRQSERVIRVAARRCCEILELYSTFHFFAACAAGGK